MKNKIIIIASVGALAIFAVGFWLGGRGGAQSGADQTAAESSESAIQFWTCSMHPQIRQPEPGQCPICGMDLIPVTGEQSAGSSLGPRELALSPAAMKLAEVETVPVERKFVSKPVRMVGKVEYDETRLAYITARVPGRLDRLYVDYTGVPVEKGDHMVYLYSPELLQAQQELIQALATARELENSESTLLRERAESTITSSQEKLRLWGLSDEQIQEIEDRKKPSDHLTINSPISGIVVHKNALEGMYVNEGTQIYTIADLSELWVKLDAYESDLPWIHYGQEVEFETEAYPGDVFKGQIAFIDPVLDPQTRTVKVRVNVQNPDGKLKPEMFVRAVVRSNIALGGKVMDPDLAGKWISPMHPEVIRDEPGNCPICGMPLVSAESLGYVPADQTKESAPLVIPSSAPLITGPRAVVYVAVPGKEGHFEGREIVLGPRAGKYYIVKQGLQAGELVVAHGNFKIDSAVQIMAKPSMMSPEGGGPMPGHHHGESESSEIAEKGQMVDHAGTSGEPNAESKTYDTPQAFKEQLGNAIESYLKIHQALSHDEFAPAQKAAGELKQRIANVDMELLEGDAHLAWMQHLKMIQQGATSLEAAADIQAARAAFDRLSTGLIAAAKQLGFSGPPPLYLFHCPMAFEGKGADWMQTKESTENPYFGSEMFTCGLAQGQIK